MQKKLSNYLLKRKYEILLITLIQHLFIATFLSDLHFYTRYIWPINMLILGLGCVGVFIEKGQIERFIKNILTVLVIVFPFISFTATRDSYFMQVLSMCYTAFFMFIFYEVMRFLVRPSYINKDVISAAACGLLLLIEISTFLFQTLFYIEPNSFKGISIESPASTFIDFVYMSSITITSIGYGDITPNLHHTKLLVSLIGIMGQFYSVILVGILISKFTSESSK